MIAAGLADRGEVTAPTVVGSTALVDPASAAGMRSLAASELAAIMATRETVKPAHTGWRGRVPTLAMCQCPCHGTGEPCRGWCEWDGGWEERCELLCNGGVRYRENAEVLTEIRSFRLLRLALSATQFEQVRLSGFTTETIDGCAFLIDLDFATVQTLGFAHDDWSDDPSIQNRDAELQAYGYCIDPDRALCSIDRLVSKLLWTRADLDDFLGTANRWGAHDLRLGSAINRSLDSRVQRSTVFEFLSAGSRLVDLIGEEATASLHHGNAAFGYEGFCFLIGADPVIVYDEWTGKMFAHSVPRTESTWTSSLEHWTPIVERLVFLADATRAAA